MEPYRALSTHTYNQDQLLLAIPEAQIEIYPRFLLLLFKLSPKKNSTTLSTIPTLTQHNADSKKPQNTESKQPKIEQPYVISLVDSDIVFEIIQEKKLIKIQNIKTGQQIIEFSVSHERTLRTVHSIFRSKMCEIGFSKKYNILSKLGKGASADVYLIQRKNDMKKFAAKVMSLKDKNQKNYEIFINEVRILRKLNHPNIVKLESIYYSKKNLFQVMQYLEGGTLLEQLRDRYPVCINHQIKIVYDIIKAVQHLRQKTIVHRDLKLQNILIRLNEDGTKDYVLSDFGLASYSNETQPLFDRCGTPGYIAPEILRAKKNQTILSHKSDVFSLGIIIHYIITAKSVFKISALSNLKELISENKKCKIDFNKPIYSQLTEAQMKMLQVCLAADPNKRYSTDQILAFMVDYFKSCEQRFKNKSIKSQTSKKSDKKLHKKQQISRQTALKRFFKQFSGKKFEQRQTKAGFMASGKINNLAFKEQEGDKNRHSFSGNKLESKDIKSSFIKESLAKSLQKIQLSNSKQKNVQKEQPSYRKNHKRAVTFTQQSQERDKNDSFLSNIWNRLTNSSRKHTQEENPKQTKNFSARKIQLGQFKN